jgi:6-phosphogluconolactonase
MSLIRLFPISLLAAAMSMFTSTLPADEVTVYVSSFAAGEKGGIEALRLSLDDGKLTRLARTSGVENPFFIAISPDQRFLYSVHAKAFGGEDDEEVAAYAIDKELGKLTLLNRQSAKGTATCYLEVDATGKTLLLANYSSGSVAAMPIREDGSLGEVASFIQHEGGSKVDPKRQSGPYAHSIIVSPDNRVAYVADLGLDKIIGYSLDATRAGLKLLIPARAASRPGAGPRHLAFAPDGKNLYSIDELSNTITRYAHDPEKVWSFANAEAGGIPREESISTLPEDFQGSSYCADLKFTPDGQFLYGTNRGHDSLAIYGIGDDGVLTLIAIEPSLGKGPQNLLITPDGKWLLCANMPGNNLAVFRIDGETGNLTPVGPPLEITMPSCIRLLP